MAIYKSDNNGRFVIVLDRGLNDASGVKGTATGNTIEFTFGTARFRIECTEPVAANGDHAVIVFRKRVDVSAPAFGSGGTGTP